MTYVCTLLRLDAVLILSPALIANNPERNVYLLQLLWPVDLLCYIIPLAVRKLMYLTTKIFTVAEIYQYFIWIATVSSSNMRFHHVTY